MTGKQGKSPEKAEKKLRKKAELPVPTEQEKDIYEVLASSFVLEDDAARAVARFEAEVIFPRYRDGDENSEEFDRETFQILCERLNQLALVKNVLPLFGLEKYEEDIIRASLPSVFRKPNNSDSQVFKGDDEAFLEHYVRTTK